MSVRWPCRPPPLVHFALSDTPEVTHTHHDQNGAIEARVRALLNDGYSRDIRVGCNRNGALDRH